MIAQWVPSPGLLDSCRGLSGPTGGPPGRVAIRAAHPELSDHKARIISDALRKDAPAVICGSVDKGRRFEVEEFRGGLRVFSVDTEIRTVEDALAKGEVDLAIWEPYKTKVNSWPVAVKTAELQVETVWLWQVSVECRRKVSAAIAEACPEIIKRMEAHSPAYRKAPAVKRLTDPHLLELSLADHHFGKLAWGRETGEDWDLRIAENVWLDAVDDLLAKVTKKNLHGEVDTGPARGAEVW
jgi:hypothetical protein